jgi:hypothetical protein
MRDAGPASMRSDPQELFPLVSQVGVAYWHAKRVLVYDATSRSSLQVT